jgi:diguanylate cyclase (GGDEF)-like protein
MWIDFFVPKVFRGCENLAFRLFEHFVEQRNIAVIQFVPNVRVSGILSRRKALSKPTYITLECRICRFELKRIYRLVVLNMCYNPGMNITNNLDITSNKQYEFIYQDNQMVLEYIAKNNDLIEILDKIVHLAEHRNPNSKCSILILNDSKKNLLSGSAPSLPDFYNEAINGVEIGEKVGSCGSATFKQERVIVEDIDTHENWQPYLALTQKANLHACWSEPIFSSSDEILGSFAIYYDHIKSPTDFELKLISSYAHLASVAIEKENNNKLIKEKEQQILEQIKKSNDILEDSLRLINNIIDTVSVRIFWKDKNGTYLGANKLFLEDAKLSSKDEIIGKNDFQMPWGKTEAKLYRDDDLQVMNSDISKINFEEIQTNDKGEVTVLLTSKIALKNTNEDIIGVLGSYMDITKQRKIEDELREQKVILSHQAQHDALTGLPNRVLFNDRLEQAIEKAKRNNSKVALLFIDLDHFKEINDSLGHDIGDEILKEVTHRLRGTIRDEDTVARLGGDEFTVILEDLNQGQDASSIAAKLLESLAKSMHINDNVLYVSSSIGISIYPDDGVSAKDLLKFADSAMYKAKDDGRNNFQYYNASMTELAFERVVMETSLRAALKNNEFIVYYQPQVNGATDKLIGMEALVRWQHPTMGLVAPDKFIPLAESTGLIVELDRYVMKRAMMQISQWYEQGLNPGVLAMNLAIKQFQRQDFIPMFKELMQETNCQAEWLELEVTEGKIMTHPEESIKILNEISDLGIELAVDDFGTGYSSLAYLKRLPIDKLKIDQAFIRDLPDDEEDAVITKAVIALSKSLNLKVIAEGVETKEQRDFLVENGCKKIQGYFYSKPIPADELELILRNGF